MLHARVGLTVAGEEMSRRIQRMLALMTGKGIRSQLALAFMAGELRRRPRDRWVIGLLIAVGAW